MMPYKQGQKEANEAITVWVQTHCICQIQSCRAPTWNPFHENIYHTSTVFRVYGVSRTQVLRRFEESAVQPYLARVDTEIGYPEDTEKVELEERIPWAVSF